MQKGLGVDALLFKRGGPPSVSSGGSTDLPEQPGSVGQGVGGRRRRNSLSGPPTDQVGHSSAERQQRRDETMRFFGGPRPETGQTARNLLPAGLSLLTPHGLVEPQAAGPARSLRSRLSVTTPASASSGSMQNGKVKSPRATTATRRFPTSPRRSVDSDDLSELVRPASSTLSNSWPERPSTSGSSFGEQGRGETERPVSRHARAIEVARAWPAVDELFPVVAECVEVDECTDTDGQSLEKMLEDKIPEEVRIAIEEEMLSEEADLDALELGPAGAALVALKLKDNKHVKSLSLRDNNIECSGAVSLAVALMENDTLESLFLRGNNIADRGAKALADLLRVENFTLEELYMGNNNFGDKAALAFAEMLTVNERLAVLYVNANNIGETGAGAILEAVKANDALSQLGFDDNLVSGPHRNIEQPLSYEIKEAMLDYESRRRRARSRKRDSSGPRQFFSGGNTLTLGLPHPTKKS